MKSELKKCKKIEINVEDDRKNLLSQSQRQLDIDSVRTKNPSNNKLWNKDQDSGFIINSDRSDGKSKEVHPKELIKKKKSEQIDELYKEQLNKACLENKIKMSKIREEQFNTSLNLKIKEQEAFYLNQKLILKNHNIFDLFLINDFVVFNKNNQLKIKQITEWQKISNENLEIGNQQEYKTIIIKNKILRFNDNYNFNLKTLQVKLEIEFSMTGESTFYIFSRIKHNLNKDNDNNLFSTQTAVCSINKDLDSSRKFINFSILNKINDKEFGIKTLKKQEIPKHQEHNKDNDVSNLNLTFFDEGNNNTSIELKLNGEKHKFEAGFFLPGDDFTNIFMASTGDLICLKSISVSHLKKQYWDFEALADKQTCSCCVIF